MEMPQDPFLRPGLTVGHAKIQFAIERAFADFVNDGTAIPEEIMHDLGRHIEHTDNVLNNTSELVVRPIHPDKYDEVKARADKLDSLMTLLWQKEDARHPRKRFAEDDGRFLPSMDASVRYGLSSDTTRSAVIAALSRRGQLY